MLLVSFIFLLFSQYILCVFFIGSLPDIEIKWS